MSEDNAPPEAGDDADAFIAAAEADQIAALRAEAVGLKEQALRYAAEAENTKRRAEREANDARAYAIQKLPATSWASPTIWRARWLMCPATALTRR